MSPWFLEQIRLPPEPVQVFLVAPVAFVSEFLLQSRHIPTERSLGKTAQSCCSPALWGELLSVSQTPPPPGFGKRGRVSTGDVRLSLAPRELPDRGGTRSGNRPEELVWASSGCAPGVRPPRSAAAVRASHPRRPSVRLQKRGIRIPGSSCLCEELADKSFSRGSRGLAEPLFPAARLSRPAPRSVLLARGGSSCLCDLAPVSARTELSGCGRENRYLNRSYRVAVSF